MGWTCDLSRVPTRLSQCMGTIDPSDPKWKRRVKGMYILKDGWIYVIMFNSVQSKNNQIPWIISTLVVSILRLVKVFYPC